MLIWRKFIASLVAYIRRVGWVCQYIFETWLENEQGTLSILCRHYRWRQAFRSLFRRRMRLVAMRSACDGRRFHGRLAKGAGSKVLASEDALQTASKSAVFPTCRRDAILGIRVNVVGHASNDALTTAANNAAVSLSDFVAPGQVLISVLKRAVGFD
jgi:hypothetical protein